MLLRFLNLIPCITQKQLILGKTNRRVLHKEGGSTHFNLVVYEPNQSLDKGEKIGYADDLVILE